MTGHITSLKNRLFQKCHENSKSRYWPLHVDIEKTATYFWIHPYKNFQRSVLESALITFARNTSSLTKNRLFQPSFFSGVFQNFQKHYFQGELLGAFVKSSNFILFGQLKQRKFFFFKQTLNKRYDRCNARFGICITTKQILYLLEQTHCHLPVMQSPVVYIHETR